MRRIVNARRFRVASVAAGALAVRAMPLLLVCAAAPAIAQDAFTVRAAIATAEDHRAPTPHDVAVIRTGLHNANADTVRIAVRALGRLERPTLVADIAPLLRSPFPEVRAEAANALGQAVVNAKSTPAVSAAAATLAARLAVEAEPAVRAAILATIGRLPYDTAAASAHAEQQLLDAMHRSDSVFDRLGAAQGFEALARLDAAVHAPGADAIAACRQLATLGGAATSDVQTASVNHPPMPARRTNDSAGEARIRRLALSALIASKSVDAPTVARAAVDADFQVRLLAMRAAAQPGAGATAESVLVQGLDDEVPAVRVGALQALFTRDGPGACDASTKASHDSSTVVALVALDQLRACGASPAAIAQLEELLAEDPAARSTRGWHRAAHALVALAQAAPDRAAAKLERFAASAEPHVRAYAARAAAVLNDRVTLERLARDKDDNIVESAIEGLARVAGHDSDAVYVAALSRPGYQAIRAAAVALAGTPESEAVAALRESLARLTAEDRDNSRDARAAILDALRSVGAPGPALKPVTGLRISSPPITASDLRRLSAARARVTIKNVGTFELALLGAEAPATVLRVARLAEAGYYNGLTVHRVVPNFVIQGGSPGANEFVGDATYMRDEVGLWPHVRGAVGISTRGHDTGDAQLFVDLVDNPRLDHVYTVFGQVLNGIDVIDAILEGDVIERVEIIGS